MREDIHEYFIRMANMVGTRSTCDRGHVGCIIVKDKRIISTGYSGAPSGAKQCDEVGHEIVDNHCIRTTHAEINAIVNAAKAGVSIDNSVLYITMFPCYSCAKSVINAGIKEIYSEYDSTSSPRAKEIFDEVGIKYTIINNKNKEYDK